MHDVVRLDYGKPYTRHEGRKDEGIESWPDPEVMQNGISSLNTRRLERTAPHFRFAVDDADRKLKLLLKDLCEDSLHGPVTSENNDLLPPCTNSMKRRNHTAQLGRLANQFGDAPVLCVVSKQSWVLI